MKRVFTITIVDNDGVIDIKLEKQSDFTMKVDGSDTLFNILNVIGEALDSHYKEITL
jgi:hypothetical protein